MTVVAINPRSTPGINAGAQQIIASLAAQLSRVDSRVAALEATRTSIGANAVTTTQIGQGTIVAANIHAGAIDASVINAGSIGAAVGTFVSINASQIVAGNITTGRMQANVLSAVQASISTLSAITANMGSITAGTITGGVVQSATSGARWVGDSGGFRGYALDGVTKTFEINLGTGIASFTGVATLDPASVIPVVGLSGTLGGYNLLPNASFEDARGVMFGWPGAIIPDPSDPTNVNKAAITTGGGTARLETTTAWDLFTHGSRGVKFTPSANGTGVNYFGAPTIKGKPNTKYTVSIWLKGTSSTPRSLTCMVGSTKADTTSNANLFPFLGRAVNGGWTRFSATFTTPSDVRDIIPWLHFNDDGDSGVIYFDAVQLEEGEKATTFGPRADENIYASINSLMIGAGEIKANNIDVGAIQTSHISFRFNSANKLPNARFAYWPTSGDGFTSTGMPGYWQAYENIPGEAAARAYSRVQYGGPDGGSSWRVTIPAATLTAPKGFMTYSTLYPYTLERQPNEWYTMSWWWKGNKQPIPASNGNELSGTGQWIDNPATSATKWQRYSYKFQMGPLGGKLSNNVSQFNFDTSLGIYAVSNDSGVAAALTRITTGTITGAGSMQIQQTANTTTNGALAQVYPNGTTGLLDVTASGSVGQPWRVQGSYKFTAKSGTVTNVTVILRCFDSGGSYIGYGGVASGMDSTVGTLNKFSGVFDPSQFPAATKYVGVQFQIASNIGTTYTMVMDDFVVDTGPFVDFLYIFPYYDYGIANTATDVQIANPQFEQGQFPSSFAARAEEVLPGSVGNTQIGPDSITTDKILAGAVQAGDMSVSTLSAITANMGSITAGTITGATVQSAASGSYRALLDSSGFYYKDPSNNNLFSATGGGVSMTGTVTASALSFINTGGTINASNSTIRFYSGAVGSTTLAGHSAYALSGGRTLVESIAQSSTSGALSEWRARAGSYGTAFAATKSMSAVIQSSSGLDAFRVMHTNQPGYTDRQSFSVDETGDASIGRSMFLFNNFGAGVGRVYDQNTTYSQIFDGYGMRFDGGNYTTMATGISGGAVVALINSGATPAGTVMTLGRIYAEGNFVVWSDERNKHSIKTLSDKAALAKVRALRPVSYSNKGGSRSPVSEMGFIAQEVVEVIPDAVEKMMNVEDPNKPETTYTIAPMALIAALTNAVQELSECVNILRGEKPDAKLSRETVKALV